MIERLTFALALLGYAGLTVTAIVAAHGQLLLRFWRVVAPIIVVHVLLVWTFRYEWHLAIAVRNGYAGFVIFHAALAMIVASVVVAERYGRVLVLAAFVIVTLGAIGAVFRYDVVAGYRAPVILIAVAGTAGLGRAFRLGRLQESLGRTPNPFA